MAVGAGAAVAGHVLDHGQHAAIEKAADGGTAEFDDGSGIGGKRPVPDNVVRARHGNVEHRGAIDGNAEVMQFVRDETGREIRRVARAGLIVPVEIAEDARGRTRAPMGRAKARDAAAFLIDQDRRAGPPHRRAQIRAQRADLVRVLAVAGEEDEAERVAIAKERAFAGA